MGATRKSDLDQRLDAYFDALPTWKRTATNWQLYAAVTGSALAMVTNASAQMIASGVRGINADPVASARAAQEYIANSQNMELRNAIRLAMAPHHWRTGASARAADRSRRNRPSG